MGRPWREGADQGPSEIGQKTDVKESYFISFFFFFLLAHENKTLKNKIQRNVVFHFVGSYKLMVISK